MQGRAAEEVTTRTRDPDGPAATDMDELRKNLDFMMAHYEGELKKPIRNLVSGRLPRTLLIQVAPSHVYRHTIVTLQPGRVPTDHCGLGTACHV